MKLSDARKELKNLGFNLRTERLGWGPHATITNSNRNEDLPTIFTEETRSMWLPAIEWKDRLTEPVTTDSGEFVFGLTAKPRTHA
jgi:hypothetical protein